MDNFSSELSDDHAVHDPLIMWDCGSPLYDSYELVSLTHVIERHLMALPSAAAAAGSGSSKLTLTTKLWLPVSDSGGGHEIMGRRQCIMKRKVGERKNGGKRLRMQVGCFCTKGLMWKKKWRRFTKRR